MEMKGKLIRTCTLTKNVHDLLLKYLKDSDTEELEYLLKEEVEVNYVYKDTTEFFYEDKNALQIACAYFAEETNEKCIQLLLDYGADIFYKDPDSQKNSLNFAAESGNYKILKTILKYIKRKQPEINNSDVIYTLIKYIRDSEMNEEKYISILKLLLDTDIDINYQDIESGWTTIYIAAKYKYQQFVQNILDMKKTEINLDEFKDRRGKSARDLIIHAKLYDGELPEYTEENTNVTISTLYNNIRNRSVDEFTKNFEFIEDSLKGEVKYLLLNMAVKKRLKGAVKILLDNEKYSDNQDNSLTIAAQRGYFKIIKLFMSTKTNGELVSRAIFELLKTTFTTEQSENVNYNECLTLLLKSEHLDINAKDSNNNTALHYALRYQDPEMALKILRKGAKLGSKDSFNRLAIADMDSLTLETHLNECIGYENEEISTREDACLVIAVDVKSEKAIEKMYEEKLKSKQDSSLIINLSSLLPIKNNLHTQEEMNTVQSNQIDEALTETSSNENHINIELVLLQQNNSQSNIIYDAAGSSHIQQDKSDVEDGTKQNNFKGQSANQNSTAGKEYLSETEVIQHMCTDELRINLKHPVISVFLFFKWERVKIFFLINFCIYFLFGIILLLFIFVGTNDQYFILYSLLVITLVYIFIREILQIVIYKSDYIKNFENSIEIIIIISTIGILATYSNEMLKRQFSAVAIVATAFELILQFGKFYLVSHIMMLRTVSYEFSKLFLLYAILLVAYAYSFYILFQETKIENNFNANDTETKMIFNCSDNKRETDLFENVGLSLLKTFVMLTGEFDATDLRFNSHPFVSHALFVIFVFVIAIILYNLLNGLAVSDIQIIKNDAELYGLIMRVEVMVQIERIFLLWLKIFPRKLHFSIIKESFIFNGNFENTKINIYLKNRIAKVENENKKMYLNKKIPTEILKLMRKIESKIKRQNKEDKMFTEIREIKQQLKCLRSNNINM